MLQVKRYLILFSLVMWGLSVATAQHIVKPTSEEASSSYLEEQTSAKNYDTKLHNILIRYEHAKAWPRWDYEENRTAYKALIKSIKEISSDRESIRTIIIEGAASPIGSDAYNQALALRRAAVLRNIIAKMEGGDKLQIHIISTGEDWITFSQHIRAHYHRANREKVLAILDLEESNNSKERKLVALDKGATWRLLVDEYMGPARNAAVVRIVESEPVMIYLQAPDLCCKVKPAELIPPFDLPKREFNVEQVKEEPKIEQPNRKPVMAFRSNLLVPALNLGIEVPIGNHWSVATDYYFPWVWPKRDNKDCFEMLSWGIEARYWFGHNRTIFNRLQGHSLGLYGYVGYYDFERNFHGYQGEFANIGLDYTYAMAVGKRKQVHFEFSLGVGFIHSQARKYSVIESGSPLISEKITKMVNFFGPTKANISLVVPIFQSVKPNDKNRGDE